ncbi:ADP-ribosylglycohydrolase family protein [Sanguibacter sp. HDW7]|uniref:ADP-ribosylglycohydrolase family protein n=1 Tax=Sanguibacter sp. HDW7 TaxID=2714931 RepID=UPI00140BD6F6|nr:ADP-ribosylglycohydrolase family protein [Sanguibacter sp. HDW7]QIK84721.1 ADP-ribosylglycohydrolase family protein [Sanguibacter sp. HDW7]
MVLTTQQKDRAVGVVLGAALADAVGAPYEFQAPLAADQPVRLAAGGTFGWEKGEWTDDTSMAVPILRALAAGEPLDDAATLGGIVGAWKDWARDAKDVGIQTRQVLGRAESTEASAVAASDALHAETGRSGGNGSLMRLAPVIVATLDDAGRTAAAAARQSTLTHHDPEAAEACVLWALTVRHAVLTGEADLRALPADRAAHWAALLDEAEAHLPVHWYGSNGWVRSSLQSAWSAVVHGTDYRSRVELAVRGGGDTDTVAAITGMLEGALAGHSRLPLTWLRHLHGWGGRDIIATGDDLARLTEIVLDGAPGRPGAWPRVERMPVSDDTTPPVAHPDDPGVLLADLSALDGPPAGVDAVVSLCRVGTAQPAPAAGVRPEHHVRVRLIDQQGTNLDPAATLREVADVIADLRAEGRTVLVHCYEARSRTAAAAAAYSVLRFGVEPETALERSIKVLRHANPRGFLRDAVRSLTPRDGAATR